MRLSGTLRRVLLFGLASIGSLFLLVSFTPFVRWYALQLAGPWYTPEGSVLIVLSAAGPNLGMIEPGTYWRCTYAIAAYRQHPFAHVIVSGKDIAPGMRDFLVFGGVPAERITVENESTNTHENALFTARIVSAYPGRKILLTSDSHMFRAQRAFVKQGIDTVPSPIPDVIKRASDLNDRWPLFVREVSETMRIVYYYYQGWI